MAYRRALLWLSVLVLVAVTLVRPARAAGEVGDGSPASCTFTALQTALAGGGLVTFNCGPNPLTITVTSTLSITAANTTIDGGGLITLSGGGARRIIDVVTLGTNPITLTLQNLTLTAGRAVGVNDAANGGAIRIRDQSIGQDYPPTLNLNNVTFDDNDSTLTSFSGGGLNAYDFGGGAIYAGAGIVTVTGSTFIDNDSNNGAGGAIHILRSNLTISTSSFTNSTAIGSVPANSQGGAIYMDGMRDASAVFSITDSTFTGSRSYNSGGAIYVNLYDNSSVFSVDQSSFVDNQLIGGNGALGGAISGGSTNIGGSTGNAVIRISNSLFANNSVRRSGSPQDGSGGALAFAQRARITIANSTFTGNSAFGSSFNANGGAIYITNNTEQFQIINSTIANNFAGWVGGGVVNSALPGTTTPGGIIRNTIFANNTADNGPNTWDIQQHCSAITVGGGVIPPLTNGGNNLQFPDRNPSPNFWNETVCASGITIADAQLGPLQDNGGPTETRALDLDSPAVDAGSSATCAAAPISNRDQRGQTRPIDGDGDANPVCDIGAYELVPNQPPFAPTLLTPADDRLLTSNTPTFTWTRAPFAVDYRLQVDDDANFGSPTVDVTLSGQNYTAPYLAVAGYSWRVQAINSFGDAWSTARTVTIASADSTAPQRNYVTQLDPTLSWTRVSWALGYWVRVDNNSSFSSPEYQNTSVPADQTSVVAALPGDGIYYWQVCARPTPTTCGAWSAVETIVVDAP